MRTELLNKCPSLGGQSDLTLLAPIKRGLVPSLDSITYKTRVRRLLEALQALRVSSHDHALFRPLSDSTERVARIHSFRVAIVEPDDKLLLAVTFDGAQESYLRVLWQKIGTLLDLLFCSTEGHVSAHGHTLAEWAAWIDRVQVGSNFFYGRPGVTSEDVVFLRDDASARHLETDAGTAALATVRRVTPSAEKTAWELASGSPARIAEAARQGVQTVAVLYRLGAWFVPMTPEGDFLHRAARDLLPEFRHLERAGLLQDALADARERFDEALAWFFRPHPQREVPAPPTAAPSAEVLANVQGGIVAAYENITHGALLLLAFVPGASTRPFWDAVLPLVTKASEMPVDGRLVANLAFTADGLRAAGLGEAELAAFPFEFREGMAARASALGDVRGNHPRRWRLPARHGSAGGTVELTAVHALLQLRIGNPAGVAPETRVYEIDHPLHPLRPAIERLQAAFEGSVQLLSVQPMVRHRRVPSDPTSPVVEHFGYADGAGQPVLDPRANGKVYKTNLVHLGELLLGYANAAEPAERRGDDDWLADGSFLVVRKLRQDIAQFGRVLDEAAEAAGVGRELIAAKLMGRTFDGDPLAMPGAGNDFDYKRDPLGQRCPLQAHVRRANPRPYVERDAPPELPGARAPRLVRRGMSYGPRYDPDRTEDDPVNRAPRGMIFMAYNARIAEQFEVVQRWLAGGNSTGGCSSPGDPFLGGAASGRRRGFAFECPVADADGRPVDTVIRVPLDGDTDPLELGRPLVRLEWGLYLFTPSISALAALADRARRDAAVASPAPAHAWPWSAERGRAEIAGLARLAADAPVGNACAVVQAWKAALEDPDALKDFRAASIWAAIRADGGVLRTPYGVIVASHAGVMEVLRDRERRYTVAGYRDRAMPTLGDIYLGLDDEGAGCPYRRKATRTNDAILARLDPDAAFTRARTLAVQALEQLVGRERSIATKTGSPTWRLAFSSREVVDRVLEGLSREWFGLPVDGPTIRAGSFRWDWSPGEPVLYPGHFLSPSRYVFQPQPADEVLRLGSLHGSALRAAFKAWVKALRDADPSAVPHGGAATSAPLAEAIFAAFPRSGRGDPENDEAQDTTVAETLLGALIGFLPTVDGNLRQSLNEWLKDGSFWSLRAALLDRRQAPDESARMAAVGQRLRASMQLRPSAELLWRRAARPHTIGDVAVAAGETVVVAVVSATHELLERGVDDVTPVFGGDRVGDDAAPTHACPAYATAMQVMQGILVALLETPHALRPAPAPLSFEAEGPMEPTSGDAAGTAARLQARPRIAPSGAAAAAGGGVGTGHWLLLEGDSWFRYPWGIDLADELATRYGFAIENLAASGDELGRIAGAQVDALCEAFDELLARGTPPLAVLLSAGGGDVARQRLLPLVKPADAGGGLDPDAVAAVVDGTLRAQYEHVLAELARRCTLPSGAPVPVFLLGYDHPVPDGRNIFGQVHRPTAWLAGALHERGYDLAGGRDVMRALIDRLNAMQRAVCTRSSGHAFHADLRGTLSSELAGDAYRADWADELHPTEPGFARLAQRLVEHLVDHLPALRTAPVGGAAATANGATPPPAPGASASASRRTGRSPRRAVPARRAAARR